MQVLAMIIGSTLLTVVGQICFKLGVSQFEGVDFQANSLFYTTVRMMLNVYVILGFFFFGSGAILWLYVFTRAEISYAVPVSSLSYILVLLAGNFFFGETITLIRWVGAGVIILGVTLISWK